MGRIAVVTPWYGPDLKGGAEQQARQIAMRLCTRGHAVEVLTTCSVNFFEDWAVNHYPPGLTEHNETKIRRFPVAKRNKLSFDRLNNELLALKKEDLIPGVPPVSPELGAIWTFENINSPQLYSYLQHHGNTYDAIIFIPYLYGTTLNGLPLVADRAWLQPCLHDEAYAYLPEVENVFHKAKGILFNSEGEKLLAAHLYGPAMHCKGVVVGEGIEHKIFKIDDADLPELVKGRAYLLFLGRRDPTKGLNFLLQAFRLFRSKNPEMNLALVLAGPGKNSYHFPEESILDLGLVSERVKFGLLQNALALAQPSLNESFSRVLFEAWMCSRPVVVHAKCLATSKFVRESGGGWFFGDVKSWAESFASIFEKQRDELKSLGEKGKKYAMALVNWDHVIDRYEEVLGFKNKQCLSFPSKGKLPAIHQLLPNLSYGDAISNEVLHIRGWLRKKGYTSDIIVRHLDSKLRDEALIFDKTKINTKAGIIYHHSIGSDLTNVARNHTGPKCLIYHNITPGKFFKPYRPKFTKILEAGLKEMEVLSNYFDIAYGVSPYNVRELKAIGFTSPRLFPLTIDPLKWDIRQDDRLKSKLLDGRTNILFVGRIAPNKCQHDLVEWFSEYILLDASARLIIVGGYEKNDPYYNKLITRIEELGLRGNVLLTGLVNDHKLATLYSASDLFLSMSEHEGFCVPLIEAMWFDIPVLAYNSTAIPETLGEAAMMFNAKNDFPSVAGLANLMIFDKEIRKQVLYAQHSQREKHLPHRTKEYIHDLLSNLENEAS